MTCHAPATRPGLHRVAGHAACATCHTSHGPARDDRGTCTTCHKDLDAHEPTASRCGSCHPFGNGRKPQGTLPAATGAGGS